MPNRRQNECSETPVSERMDIPFPIVDPISESRGVNDGQFDTKVLLFEFRLDDLDLGGLVQLLGEPVMSERDIQRTYGSN